MKSLKEIGHAYKIYDILPWYEYNYVAVDAMNDNFHAGVKYCRVHFTSQTGKPYIWFNKTTYSLFD